MAEKKLARRYANSLLGLADERGELDRVYGDMQLVHDACARSRDLALFLKNPIIHADKKDSVIGLLFRDKVSPLCQAFMQIITRKRRERYLQEITAEFVALYKERKGIAPARIITAMRLAPALCNEITAFLADKTKKQIELSETVDPGLIGGFVLRWGDEQMDASISRKIRELRMSFKPNLYIKDF